MIVCDTPAMRLAQERIVAFQMHTSDRSLQWCWKVRLTPSYVCYSSKVVIVLRDTFT